MDNNTTKIAETVVEKKLTCGIIMPIASSAEYTAEHWKDVLNILTDAVDKTQFKARLVSDDLAMGLIHERIVTNIYNDDVVICDVSSKNPNVMFELGLRLAFDKPTIIIKDENTGYSFDTGVMEHLPYPSSLRFNQIVKFKDELAQRINATYEKSRNEENYSPFLKSFGKTIKPASIQKTEISESKYILETMERMSHDIKQLRRANFNEHVTWNNIGQQSNMQQEYPIELQQQVVTILRDVLKRPEISRPYKSEQILSLVRHELRKQDISETSYFEEHIRSALSSSKFIKSITE